MKALYLFCFLLISGSLSTVYAQNEEVVLNLSATEFNGKVLLTWAVTQGNTCNGINVLHSTDTTNFSQVGSIEGICGSTAETIDYQFTDDIPSVNQTNYYRLSLGGIGFSYIVNVDVIDAGTQNYIVTPNPVEDKSQLIFDNENQEKVTITFFNERGEIMLEETSSEQSIAIDREKFKQGVYFFVLKSDGALESFSGKFSVI
ncbi:MAG: T9SS type A sorting domain-containing protein [Crocinitomicaceae bacterium]|nr:T9SS type A sorting domain-containing protein [Crocinitomicaceae bacterium]